MIKLDYLNIKRQVDLAINEFNKGKIDEDFIMQAQTSIFVFCNKYANVLKTNNKLLRKITDMQAQISEIRRCYSNLDIN